MRRIDAESETLITCPLTGNPYGDDESRESLLVTHSLRADGFDASEDGTRRGTPLVAVTIPILEAGARTGVSTDDPRAGIGIGADGDPMFTLQSGKQHAVAFRASGQEGFTPSEIAPPLTSTDGGGTVPSIGFYGNDSGNDAGIEVCPTLRSMEGGGGNHPSVVFQEGQIGCREYATSGTLRSNGPGHDPVGSRVRSGMAVRRLTPTECERLQGFPDGYTQIPYKKVRIEKLEADYVKYLLRGGLKAKDECFRLAADGPRYKALGNSWAVPCVAWIFERMDAVDKLLAARTTP